MEILIELAILLLICVLAFGLPGILIFIGICATYFGLLWIFSKLC